MALDVYCREDIQNVLTGLVVVAIETHISNGSGNMEHLDGALMMARSVALAFGMPWPTVTSEARAALGTGYADLLDQAANAHALGEALK